MKKKILLIILTLVIIIFIGCFIYVNDYYHANDDVSEYLKSTNDVTINKDNNGILFDGSGENNLFIFYPGAKVEYTSYAPLMYKIAENGIDSYIVKMPFNFAFLGINKADKIISKYKYEDYYLGGHSLGGAMASFYVAGKDNITGLILLSSYSTKKLDNIKVLSIHGTNDLVASINKINKYKSNLPEDTVFYDIVGGNHASFGSYGIQEGDGNLEIDSDEQIDLTVSKILDFIGE